MQGGEEIETVVAVVHIAGFPSQVATPSLTRELNTNNNRDPGDGGGERVGDVGRSAGG